MKTYSRESVLKEIPQKFIWHTDEVHGWLEVPYRLLVKLGIHTVITDYSYRNGNIAYLEECADAATFIDTYYKFFDVKSNYDNYQFFWKTRYLGSYQEISVARSYKKYYVD